MDGTSCVLVGTRVRDERAHACAYVLSRTCMWARVRAWTCVFLYMYVGSQGRHAWEQNLLEHTRWLGLAVWPTHVSQMEPGAHRKESRCQRACVPRRGRGRRLPLTHSWGLFPITRPWRRDRRVWKLESESSGAKPHALLRPCGGPSPLPAAGSIPCLSPQAPAVSMFAQGL